MKDNRLVFIVILSAFWGMTARISARPQAPSAAGKPSISIIPQPVKVALRSGAFDAAGKPKILFQSQNKELSALAAYLSAFWEEAEGEKPGSKAPAAAKASISSIRLDLVPSLKRLGDEGYRLKIAPRRIDISALKPAGLFYGIQTLRQMGLGASRIPCAEIEDSPRFGWRGMLLDGCRHFMTVDTVKRYIDLLAYHKMNVFHWHLTEDQGWRLEIKRYPRLTEVGAWRDAQRQALRRLLYPGRGPGRRRLRRGPPRYGRPGDRDAGPRRRRHRRLSRSLLHRQAHRRRNPLGDLQRRPLPRQGIDLRVHPECPGRGLRALPFDLHPHRRRRMPETLLADLPGLPGPDQSRGPQGRERAPGLSHAPRRSLHAGQGPPHHRLG